MGALATINVFGHRFKPFGFDLKISVAFFVALAILVLGVALAFYVGNRRPLGTPLTWGEALLAGTFVFFLMLMAYGVVPNQWLQWSDRQLLWRSDRILLVISSKGIIYNPKNVNVAGSGRILVTYQALRDIIVAMIYVVFLGAQVALWSRWQKRGQKRPQPAALEQASVFGRPLVRRA